MRSILVANEVFSRLQSAVGKSQLCDAEIDASAAEACAKRTTIVSAVRDRVTCVEADGRG